MRFTQGTDSESSQGFDVTYDRAYTTVYFWSHCCPLQSVIDRPLLERLDLLKAAIAPPPPEGIFVGKGTVKGSLAKLIPGEVLLDHTVCSKICHSVEDIQAAFDEAIRVQVCMLCTYTLQLLPALNPCSYTLQSIFITADVNDELSM